MSMPTDAPLGADTAVSTRARREEDLLLPQIDHLTIVQLRQRAADDRNDAHRLGAIGATCGIAMLIADAERCDRRATELESEWARKSVEKQCSEKARHAPSDATRPRDFGVRLQTGSIGSPLRRQDFGIELRPGHDVSGAKQPEFAKSNNDNAAVPVSPRKAPVSFTANEGVRTTLHSLPRG